MKESSTEEKNEWKVKNEKKREPNEAFDKWKKVIKKKRKNERKEKKRELNEGVDKWKKVVKKKLWKKKKNMEKVSRRKQLTNERN